MWCIKVVQRPVELKLVGQHYCATTGKGTRFQTQEAAQQALEGYLEVCITIYQWRVQKVG